MARARFVTRTITVTTYKVLCLDLKTETPVEKQCVISGIFKNQKQLNKAIEKLVNSDSLKFVAVKEGVTTTNLYGMPESEFIKTAKILPSRI